MTLNFQDPPIRPVDAAADVLRELAEHPSRWAKVAEAIPTGFVNHWRDARRKVGAQGEFAIRQVKSDKPGHVDVYVRYDGEAVSS